jgi:hypothetical protein
MEVPGLYTLAVSGLVNPPKPNSRDGIAMYALAAKKVWAVWGQPGALMTGAQFGIDTDAVKAFVEIFEPKLVTIVVPDAPYNTAFVNACLGPQSPLGMTRIHVHRMRYKHQSIPKAYMARNDYLAEHADALAAFPRHYSEELRSGTWATVRRFKKLNKGVIVTPCDGVG